jgi:methyl coenzyme M reductase subunit C
LLLNLVATDNLSYQAHPTRPVGHITYNLRPDSEVRLRDAAGIDRENDRGAGSTLAVQPSG